MNYNLLTTAEGVKALMKSSKTEQEWNDNYDAVKKANGGLPAFWSEIILSGLASRASATWGGHRSGRRPGPGMAKLGRIFHDEAISQVPHQTLCRRWKKKGCNCGAKERRLQAEKNLRRFCVRVIEAAFDQALR